MTYNITTEKNKKPILDRTTSIVQEDERKDTLVRAAVGVIAECGFEGLRTREVAKKAGVTVAMVHYYFRTKEILIKEVATYIGDQYRQFHMPPSYKGEGTPLEHLEQEFADAKHFHTHHPEIAIVYLELLLRSRHDIFLQAIIQSLRSNRHARVESMLKKGIREGYFCPTISVSLTSTMIVSILLGATFSSINSFDYATACKDTIRLLKKDSV